MEIEAAGDEDDLSTFEEKLRQGPAPARVRELEREEPGNGSLPEDFQIIR